jgi:hypothetical protein
VPERIKRSQIRVGALQFFHGSHNGSVGTAKELGSAQKKRKIGLELGILIVSQLLTLFTLLLLWDQTHELAMQTKLNQQSFTLSASAAELSFNLEVMKRNQEVMFETAKDEQCYKYVWGKQVNKPEVLMGKSEQCGDAIIDVLSMALAAVDRLPGFSRNKEDWSSYTKYVMQHSPTLRQRVLDNPEWWPEVTPYARS